jgi:glycosyltransferase involved in cell wall biosynthesis
MKISVVTISFNQAKYLEECIESVIGQGYPDLEYIIVDPGSTDGSREIIEKYRSSFSRILLERDNGPADGLNNGFAQATGQIFAYINADDRLLPGSLDYAANFFQNNPEVDVLTGAIRIIDQAGKPHIRKRTSDSFSLADYASRICTIGQQATFFTNNIFQKSGGFNTQNRIAWDGELLVDMSLAGARFQKVDKLLGDFRIYPESITGSKKHHLEWVADHDRIREKIKEHGLPVYSENEAKIRRLLYKFNIIRHLSYLSVR